MNRIVRGLLVTLLSLFVLVGAAVAATEVVIIGCQGPAPAQFFVTDSSSSAGAPVVPLGKSCSQAVADLLDAGMKLVGVSSPGVGVIYTFTEGDRGRHGR